jgi:hypothetical protein
MTRRIDKETDRFSAVSAHGDREMIVELTTFLESPSSEGTTWLQGLRRLVQKPEKDQGGSGHRIDLVRSLLRNGN